MLAESGPSLSEPYTRQLDGVRNAKWNVLARLAFELGKAVREMRESREWTQDQLAEAAGMTQPAIARFEAGGTMPTIPVLERLAHALDAELVVRLVPGTSAA